MREPVGREAQVQPLRKDIAAALDREIDDHCARPHRGHHLTCDQQRRARARHLCMFHHEPALDDAAISKVLAETRRFEEITRTGDPLKVSTAYDGLELRL